LDLKRRGKLARCTSASIGIHYQPLAVIREAKDQVILWSDFVVCKIAFAAPNI
jgi:hypothetical protein